MLKKMKISILVDNQVRQRGFLAEQGLSLLVESGDLKILFDTGQTDIFLHNSRQLGIDLTAVDLVALSHGHYDHVGGLPSLLERREKLNIYAHPQILDKRYAHDATKEGLRELGLTWEKEELEKQGAVFHFHRQPHYFSKETFLTGEIPRFNQQEISGENFVKIAEKQMVEDPLLDDQALVIKSLSGWVVILGCSHAGVINTLNYVRELTGGEKIYAVVGGMHLLQATKAKIARTIAGLQSLGVEKIIPLHCTGFKACSEMSAQMDKAFTPAVVGSILEF